MRTNATVANRYDNSSRRIWLASRQFAVAAMFVTILDCGEAAAVSKLPFAFAVDSVDSLFYHTLRMLLLTSEAFAPLLAAFMFLGTFSLRLLYNPLRPPYSAA
jgi:hypothetical protein